MLTEEKLVFVHKICGTKVYGAEDEDEWLRNAIQQGDYEYQDSLRVHSAVINHRRRVQFSKICWEI